MAYIPTDSLVTDTAAMSYWHGNAACNYNSELIQGDTSLLESLQFQLRQWIDNLFSWIEPSQSNKWLWFILAIVIAGIIAFIIVTRHPSLFGRRSTATPIDYLITEDNIYGIDFPSLIERALGRSDYGAVVRLVYLQTLRQLNDAGRIKWSKSKAPMQYVREEGSTDMHQLVLLFLYIRYGGRNCSRQQADEAITYQRNILNNTGEEASQA